MQFSEADETYTINLGGSPVETPLGEEVAMRRTGNDSYSFTSKWNGKLQTDEHWKLSPDGKTLTIDWKTVAPNGKTYSSEEIDKKTSSGDGLVGTWKITNVTSDQPNTLVIHTSADEDVTLTVTATNATLHARWDGRYYRPAGCRLAPGLSVALERMGSCAFKMMFKLNGSLREITYYHLAADGRSMTAELTDGKGRQTGQQVWTKQP